MTTELALYFIIQVLRALEYAHKRRVIHRDVSPQNVLVSWGGNVKLTDFGVAKVDQWRTLTQVGEVKGNFGYMAPEQACAGKVTHRSDVYAAGMVLYELLTLTNPFSEGSLAEVVQRIQVVDPPAPSRFGRSVSDSLERTVLRALSKDPAHRFNTTAMIRALTDELHPTPADDLAREASIFLSTAMSDAKPVTTLVTPKLVGSSRDTTHSSIKKVRDQSSLGRLRVFAAPKRVDVFIDENRISVVAPVEIQTSASIEHELILRAPGFDDFFTTFTLVAGEIRDLRIVLAGC